jgi:hypothetical protein
MNKEQIAFEKWAKECAGLSLAKDENGYFYLQPEWRAWQARAALDKQDTSEIVAMVDRLKDMFETAIFPLYNANKVYDQITKIRKHLTE